MVRLLYSQPAWTRYTANTEAHVASGCDDNTIRVWDIKTNSVVLVCGNTRASVEVVCSSGGDFTPVCECKRYLVCELRRYQSTCNRVMQSGDSRNIDQFATSHHRAPVVYT